MNIPIVIPARNESKRIEKTIQSIRATFKFANMTPYIVLVDDGSKDNTADFAEGLGCHVVRLKDRGYSALGMPVLADTHNAGFEYIEKNLQDPYEFLMVIGADTTFEENYLSILLKEMNADPSLAMCAGVLDGFHTNPNAVRGSGRIIRRSFWERVGFRLPNTYYAWESYPVVAANSFGLKTRTIYTAKMQTDRPPLRSVDWMRYGIGMRENGSLFAYVLLRAAKASLTIELKSGFRLIYGYLKPNNHVFPKEMRSFVSTYQRNRILKFLRLKK
ncbi:MAG: glycosyltransferase family 2 protein [Bacteroidia bacterium]|nr:glycosyltransferase family 2 protein [Bacteroidia bacterium]